jgi:hypothetical protein
MSRQLRRKSTMTIQTQVSVQSEVYTFRPRDYDVFAGLDVDKHSIAATFTDHDRLMQSLRLPYSAAQLLNYVQKHFPGQRLAFVYEAGPTGFGLYDELMAAGQWLGVGFAATCTRVIARPVVAKVQPCCLPDP